MSVFEKIDCNLERDLLNFLDIESILSLACISSKQKFNLANVKLYNELQKLISKKSINSENIIDYASKYGHVEVLKWFKNSNLKLEYSRRVLDRSDGSDES